MTAPDTRDVAAIAKGLTAKECEAVMGSGKAMAGNVPAKLASYGLMVRDVPKGRAIKHGYRLTPLGLLVRAHLIGEAK